MLEQLVAERFEIRQRIGSGSFGVVYEALDRHRNREVALKVLERAAPDAVARFKREFRFLAEVRHPNLASMYELLVAGDQWMLSMELIRGSELLEYLAFSELQHSFVATRTPVDVLDADATMVLRPKKSPSAVSPMYLEQVRETFRQLAVALAVLHARGIVHRDVKPSNIMITSEGRVVLLDFGLVVEAAMEDSISRKMVVGTPGYMSPEQISAATPTPASDWYSFGALLYQALTGQLPFIGQTPMEIIENQMRGELRPAWALVETVPEDLAALAHDCLSRDPEARPPVQDVLRRLDIRDFDAGRTERARLRAGALVGRGRELRTLRGWIDSAEPGQPAIIHLHGSPGVGKSVLLDRLLDDVRTGGKALILGGRCRAWESVPLNAIDSIVDSLARELGRERPGAVDALIQRAWAVRQMFPVLAPESEQEIGEDTVILPARGDRLSARAASELAGILKSVAGERILLMLLDDAQWGDYQSGRMLLRLLRNVKGRVVLVLGYRSEDWRTSLLLQVIGAAGLPARELRLEELSRASIQQVMKGLTGRTARSADVYREVGGNPALVEMVASYLTDAPDGDGSALLGRAMASRLAHVSAPARRLFGLLLSSAGPLPEHEAEEMLELFETDEPLRSLRNQKLLRVRKTGDLCEIDLYHPKMRQVLAAGARRSETAKVLVPASY